MVALVAAAVFDELADDALLAAAAALLSAAVADPAAWDALAVAFAAIASAVASWSCQPVLV
ncbi:hypothetical protein WS89_04245 [Burkholderia sp. MSMB1072]|nr:hypothetical protein WS89_04245 [Burkholderia sp. MSMB1072]